MNPHRPRRRARRARKRARGESPWDAERARRDARVTAEHGPAAHWACGRKARYPTREAAIERAAVGIAHGQPFLRAYQCPYCGGWHLSSHAHMDDC